MELQRGTCFICRGTNVIKSSQSQGAYKIISILLPEEINPTEFRKVQSQSSLRFCPVCYHKLVIMKRTSKHIDKDAEASSTHCLLCKSEKNLFQVNNWPRFSTISDGIALSKNNYRVTCSDCLFYLETKNELKIRLFSKYPRLENKSVAVNNNKNKKKWQLKFSPNIKLQSTPLPTRSRRKQISRNSAAVKVVEVLSSDEESNRERNINLKSLKNFTPLKNHKSFRNHKTVKMDTKFYNQIPYVLVNILNLSDMHDNSIRNRTSDRKYTKKGKNENFKVRDKSITLTNGHDIEKRLVVNILRTNIDKYLQRSIDPDIQHLIDRFSILQSSNQTEETASLSEIQDRSVDEMETSVESKNKRKSVSFADHKNVEIGYFDIDSNKSKNRSNSDEESETPSKKQGKGILKRGETADEESIDTVQTQEKELSEKVEITQEILNASSDREIDENIENRTKSDAVDTDSESTENVFERLRTIMKDQIPNKTAENDEISVVEDENKDKPKRNKPGPLSKKKKGNTVTEDIIICNSDDDESTNKPQKSNENSIEEEVKSEEANISKNTEDGNRSVSVDDKAENIAIPVKRQKPGPLSKKRKLNIDKPEAEEVDTENNSEVNKPVEVVNGSVSETVKVKKRKPRPLSKQKKYEEKISAEKENISEETDLSKTEDGENQNNKDESCIILSEPEINDDPVEETDKSIEEPNDSLKETENISTDNVKTASNSSLKDQPLEESPDASVSEKSSKDSEENFSSAVSNSETYSISDSVTQLVDKYMSPVKEDNSSFVLENVAVEDETNRKEPDEIRTDDDKVDKNKSIPTASFNELEKNDELGISDMDKDNINSILSTMFTSEVPDDDKLFDDETGSGEDTNCGLKRKVDDDDDLNSSKERKKKRVTFCDDVT